MEPSLFGNVMLESELAVRIVTNYARLEGDMYRPDQVFFADQHGWPGDWEGRLILGLALHAQSTGRHPAYLDEILKRIPAHLNAKGYFGNVLPEGKNDEQQMAGHSWYLRGLMECRKLGYGAIVDPLIKNVVNNLLLPSLGNYARYPLDPATRWDSPDWKLSQLQKKRSTHAETSDCGCAFIMLDGATAYYEQSGNKKLRKLIYEMIARYREVDFEGIHVQTHATLSALRGIMRMYRLEQDESLLALVKKIFTLYKTKAWTAVYGNYNWFGLPRWTEPCAILDSFLLATQLWQATGDTLWLNDAYHVYYNAMAFAQRATGAFGTDTCVGPSGAVLSPITYEVVWCCTMRGAEGLTSAGQYSFFTDKDSITVPFYQSCHATLNVGSSCVVIREISRFPYEGEVEFVIEKSQIKKPLTMRFCVPPGCGPAMKVKVNGKAAKVTNAKGVCTLKLVPAPATHIALSFEIKQFAVTMPVGETSRKGSMLMYGPLVLGLDTEQEIRLASLPKLTHVGKGVHSTGGKAKRVFRPLCDISRLTTEQTKLQVIF